MNRRSLLATIGLAPVMPVAAVAITPRYHSGGVVGVKPGELPVIIQHSCSGPIHIDARGAARWGSDLERAIAGHMESHRTRRTRG